MDKQVVEQFKNLFLNLKNKELENQALELEESKIGDEAEKSLADRENNLMLKLQGRQRHYLKKIDQALERIDEGCFGECEDCGDEISTQRLFARPTATLCISCKEEQEGQEWHIRYDKKSHTHGKELLNEGLYNISSLQSSTEHRHSLNAI